MSDQIPFQKLELAKAQDWTLEFRILAPEIVTLNGDALIGATTLTIKPLDYALNNGDKLLFGRSTVVMLSAGAAAGVMTLSVGAIAGPLKLGDVGQKIRDISGYSIDLEILEKRGDATAKVQKSASLSDPTNGLCQVAGVAADWSTLTAKAYYWSAWRRNAGSARPLAHGTLELQEMGFL